MNSFSPEFQEKIRLCLDPDSENHWILQDLEDNKSITEIVSKYIETSDYDGNFLTSTSDALFNAFINFKNGELIDFQEARYLCSRGGILGFSSDGEKTICFSVRELIRELDGPEFDLWLNKMANPQARTRI